ncbi:hypothetical protein AN416_38535 (plasmid) [Paraburkholderia caribensis]|nr:hypothetical protein AN416_38535 [Paraburkholderia caribensis]
MDTRIAGAYIVKAADTVPKAARTPDLLSTRFINLIGKLFRLRREVRSGAPLAGSITPPL